MTIAEERDGVSNDNVEDEEEDEDMKRNVGSHPDGPWCL